ncbi:dihydroxyacetone kinase subunit L [Actinospica durhamensis]|uniref:Dihydroxyacetone kinase subunit L n=1 Tax=Actinospica durhamensis TaxID=1508375 RepID=A0A941EW81_9ACTN|nr:dihydroxyacetone kinase subunit DhaL [Actinospica durhamensis]MBR7839405.1 dihydroxyacetone kinase subunit L [Actinospica durhamensis]
MADDGRAELGTASSGAEAKDGGFDAALGAAWLTAAADAVAREAERLSMLDAAIGDGDHGTNLKRGFAAVAAKLAEGVPATPGAVLVLTGRQLISTVGGASGPLYGSLLRATGKALGETESADVAALAAAFTAGVEAVAKLGGASVGDKTMIDALSPAVEALRAAAEDGVPTAQALDLAARAAEEGAQETVPLRARKGRASYLGERSEGHEDPGAASTALLLRVLADAAA